jgi:hypothetical protein
LNNETGRGGITPQKGRNGMKWYLVITTTIGTLDLGKLGNYYRCKADAEKDAERARTLPDTVKVEVKHN